MTKEELIDRINDIEWEDFEAKEAKSELPKNVWETVGAFANSSGGWIVLGIKQTGKKFEVTGVDNAEKLEQDFLGTLRSQKFNEPLEAKAMLYHIDGKKVLAFHVPSSPHKPIYYNNPQNTFIRFGSGDQRATNGEITAMFHNQSFGIKSEEILPKNNLAMLNDESIQDYRNYFKLYSNRLYSNPRNPIIAKMFRLVNISETIGYGFDMMNEWKKITERNVDFESDLCTSCVTFWLPSNRAGDRAGDRAGNTDYFDTTDKVVAILKFCKEPRTRKDIYELIGVTYHFKNFKAYIEPLLTNGYLEQTIPDKPSSPKQQYRTTRSGLIFVESI